MPEGGAGHAPLPVRAARPGAEGFRGKITLDPDLCFGCGGCANVCPARVIEVRDTSQHTRVLEFYWRRCTYCGRCEEVCPEGAITLSQEFETATDQAEDMLHPPRGLHGALPALRPLLPAADAAGPDDEDRVPRDGNGGRA